MLPVMTSCNSAETGISTLLDALKHAALHEVALPHCVVTIQVTMPASPIRVTLLSPYHSGSHQAWGNGYANTSQHDITLLTLPGQFWKWRMHGGAVTLARQFLASAESNPTRPDILIATDMLDLTTFLALTRSVTADLPVVLYMHENQLTYPLPADGTTGPMRRQRGERDFHYVFINYASMLAANEIWFNSDYHMESWFHALPVYLNRNPEDSERDSVEQLRQKSRVVPVGVDFGRFDQAHPAQDKDSAEPLILWNQRWEYDKNPEAFFNLLDKLDAADKSFRVAVCGENFSRQPDIFDNARERLGKRVIHFGYAEAETYRRLLWEADIVISTADHEFFGISILEAIYCRTFPILPHRLSYPELIPAQFHATCLYADDYALWQRVNWALDCPDAIVDTANRLSAEISAYNWSHVAQTYDQHLQQILKNT
jgi:glycosyltransferase involved in cell wall biosynthesis